MVSVHEILNSNTVKDLGVLVDHKLNFKAHIEDCVVRARQRSALIYFAEDFYLEIYPI